METFVIVAGIMMGIVYIVIVLNDYIGKDDSDTK